MLRKPSYCCNCGEKVERVEWRVWNSTRFCELCETEYVFDEWWPRATVIVLVVFGLTGFGFHFGREPKPAPVINRSLVFENPGNDATRTKDWPETKDSRALDGGESNNSGAPTERALEEAAAFQKNSRKVPETPTAVYYCEAITKKGTPCSRKVKKKGRCWQHRDRPELVTDKAAKSVDEAISPRKPAPGPLSDKKHNR